MKPKINILFLVLLFLFFINFICFAQWEGVPLAKWITDMSISESNIYIGTEYSGLFLSTDYGVSWKQTSIYNKYINGICTIGSQYSVCLCNSILYSTNNGMTWNQSMNGIPASCLSRDDSNFYIGTLSSGIFKSTNKGVSWMLLDSSIKNITRISISGPNFYANDSKKGIYSSTNYGQNWSYFFTTREQILGFYSYSSNIFAGTFNSTIFRSTNCGKKWDTLRFPEQCVYSFARIKQLLFAGSNHGVYVSSDDGETWSQTSLKSDFVFTIGVSDKTIFAGTTLEGVYYSTNYGKSWVKTSLIDIKIHKTEFKKYLLPGRWTSFISPPLMAGNSLTMEFKADSFYYHNSKFSDVFEPNDSCHQVFGDDYASGKYVIDDSCLYLYGNWTDNTFKNILPSKGCNTGEFELIYNYEYFSNHLLNFQLKKSIVTPNTTYFNSFILYKR